MSASTELFDASAVEQKSKFQSRRIGLSSLVEQLAVG